MVQVFAEANFLSAMPFIFAKFDGVLGMGYPNAAIDGITPVFDHIMSQHILKEEVFSVYYSRYVLVRHWASTPYQFVGNPPEGEMWYTASINGQDFFLCIVWIF